jgi:hypothetical protein
MNRSTTPIRGLLGLFSLLILASPPARAAGAPASDNAAALLAIAPRTNLPPEADDPARPPNTRWVKPSATIRHPYWTDDAWVVGPEGIPFNAYLRSPYGTWTNYDEARANPFPLLPELLVLRNGQPVRDADTWWKERRPEILGDFLTEIYGRIPENTPGVAWEVASVNEGAGVRTKTIVGHIDNSAYPDATPAINLTLTLPANASGPVPVMVTVVPGEGGGPRRGAASGASGVPGGANAPAGPSPLQQVLARGWGYAVFTATSVQADNGAGLTRGIIGLMNKGRPRSPDQWGDLSAWAWGLSRAVDYFETDRDVDAKQLGVEGHSRWGKTALWAAALDQRWAIVYASCSGEGGAKLHRRNFGETVDNMAASYWMAGNFHKYGGGHWNDLPVDAHELIALVAPRPVFVTGGTQDLQADPHGEFLAEVAAGPAYRLLGKNDLGTTVMPAPDVALISGDLGFREHVGPHTDVLDWPVFLEYASKYLKAQAKVPKGSLTP